MNSYNTERADRILNGIASLAELMIFKSIFENQNVTSLQLSTFTSVLMKNNIPFEISYNVATRKDSASAEITIYINPSTTMVFHIDIVSS